MFKVYIKSLLSVLIAFLVIGCSSDSSDSSNGGGSLTDSTITGSAIDGYLVYSTVCLDLNKNGSCQPSEEPSTSTDVNGSFSLTIEAEQKSHANYETAPLLVYGGYDADTNSKFTGKLKSTFNDESVKYITPITTMVQAMVEEGTQEADAEVSVIDMLDLPDGTDLGANPVEAAKTDPRLLRATLQLQKTMEILANSLQDANTSADINNLVEGLYTDMAFHLQNAGVDTNINAMLSAVVANNDDLDDSDKNGAIAVSEQVQSLVGTQAITNTTLIGTKISAVQNEVVDAIENNQTIDTSFVFDSTTKTFSLLHAEEILRITQIEDTNGLALAIAAVLDAASTAASIPENKFLPIDDEIIALKDSANTAAVIAVGLAFEAIVTGITDAIITDDTTSDTPAAAPSIIGSWTVADTVSAGLAGGTTTVNDYMSLNLVILSNEDYYFTQGNVGAEGVAGGIEVGKYTFENNEITTSLYDNLIINTNAHDTIAPAAIGGTASIVYNPTEDTITFEDDTQGILFTMTRNKVVNRPEVGAWIVMSGDTMVAIATLDKSGHYMISDINLTNPTAVADVGGVANMFEMGTYEVNSTNITATIDTIKDYNGDHGFGSAGEVIAMPFIMSTDGINIDIGGGYTFSRVQDDNVIFSNPTSTTTAAPDTSLPTDFITKINTLFNHANTLPTETEKTEFLTLYPQGYLSEGNIASTDGFYLAYAAGDFKGLQVEISGDLIDLPTSMFDNNAYDRVVSFPVNLYVGTTLVDQGSFDNIGYDGTNWYIVGDNSWLEQNFLTAVFYWQGGNKESLIQFMLGDTTYALSQGTQSIIVTGPGLPTAGKIFDLSQAITYLDEQVYFTDTEILAMPLTDLEYTVNYYSQNASLVSLANTPLNTSYKTVLKRPPLSTETTTASFPSISVSGSSFTMTPPTGEALSYFMIHYTDGTSAHSEDLGIDLNGITGAYTYTDTTGKGFTVSCGVEDENKIEYISFSN